MYLVIKALSTNAKFQKDTIAGIVLNGWVSCQAGSQPSTFPVPVLG